MSQQKLEEKIGVSGLAPAIVVLKPNIMLRGRADIQTSGKLKYTLKPAGRGRVSRPHPAVDEQAVAELSGIFYPGDTDQSKKQRPPMLHLPRLGIAYGFVDRQGLQNLQENISIEEIHHAPELTMIRPHAESAAGSASPEIAWGLQRMGVPQMWERGLTGADVLVAHLDTGADALHPMLKDAIAEYMVFDSNGHRVVQQGLCKDSADHGTHTASIIAGRSVAGGPVIGVAPGAKLACATVIDGGDAVARVLAGMEWALEIGARILNLSLGFLEWDDSFLHIMKTLRAQQLLPVVAIGNEGANRSRSPGNYGYVLSVGAVTENSVVAPFSGSENHDQFSGPKLCAPGVNILGAAPAGQYKSVAGTSESTPFVAGLAALLFDAKPKASIEEIEQAIIASCERPAGSDPARIGAGIPNGPAALSCLR